MQLKVLECYKSSGSQIIYDKPNILQVSIIVIKMDLSYSGVKKSLINRLNLVKCFHSNAHPNTIISIMKALILSKSDYGVAVYGNIAF